MTTLPPRRDNESDHLRGYRDGLAAVVRSIEANPFHRCAEENSPATCAGVQRTATDDEIAAIARGLTRRAILRGRKVPAWLR